MHPIMFFISFSNHIKLYHWMTTSYPKHIASDKLSDKLSELSDKFVEVYIGKYHRPKFTKKDLAVHIELPCDTSIYDYLNSCLSYLYKDLMKYISEKDTDLVNIRDEIITEINQTKYLLSLK